MKVWFSASLRGPAGGVPGLVLEPDEDAIRRLLHSEDDATLVRVGEPEGQREALGGWVSETGWLGGG